MTDSSFAVGDRVRMVASTRVAQAGEEGRIFRVDCAENGRVVALDILIDGDPATTRGTTVFPHEVEVVARSSGTQ